jgi:hypothetical protein
MRLARTAPPLPRRSDWLESNQQSPVPETGGVPFPLQPDESREEGLASLNRGRRRRHLCESTPKPSVARRHACQPPVAAARGPYPVSDAGCTLRPSLRAAVVPSLPRSVRRRPVFVGANAPDGPGRGPGGAREVDDRGIEPRSTAVSERRLPSRPVVESRLRGASPGSRTLLGGLTTRGLATSLATQSRREDSNPRASTVGAWCSPLSYGERSALDGSRTRLARQTTGSRPRTRPRA